MDLICQIWIIICGCASIWFIGRVESWKKWGYLIGLCSEPAWVYTTVKHEQWGILLLTIWYAYAWWQGIYNYWILPYKQLHHSGEHKPRKSLK